MSLLVRLGVIAGLGTLLSNASGATDVFKAALGFLVWITHPTTWLRVVEFLLGIGLLFLGLRALLEVFRSGGGGNSTKKTRNLFRRRSGAEE